NFEVLRIVGMLTREFKKKSQEIIIKRIVDFFHYLEKRNKIEEICLAFAIFLLNTFYKKNMDYDLVILLNYNNNENKNSLNLFYEEMFKLYFKIRTEIFKIEQPLRIKIK